MVAVTAPNTNFAISKEGETTMRVLIADKLSKRMENALRDLGV